MSSIRISGDTSGYYDLSVPAVAGTNTIELNRVIVADASGNVGIGTSSPSAKLHVSGAMPALTGGFGQLQVFSTNALAANVGGKISLGGVSGEAGIYDPYGFAYVAGLKENATSTNFAGYLAFGTANSGGSVLERLRIDSSGNVGIGTDAPGTNTLAITGAVNQAALSITNADLGGLHFNNRGNRYLTSNGTGWTTSFDGADPGIVIAGDNANSEIKSVGIVLHNDNNSDNQYSPTISFGAKSNSGAYNSTYAHIVGRKTSQGPDSNWNAGELGFYTQSSSYTSTPAMLINGDGNVGIGTTAPNANLHTAGSSTNIVSAQVQNTEGTGSRLDMYAFGSSPAIQSAHRSAVYQWTGAGIDLWSRTGDLHFGTSNVERMRIDSVGRVTMPYQPAFSVYANTNETTGAGGTAPFNGIIFDQGNNYSTANRRFVAPVAGIYQFSTYTNANGVSAGSAMWCYFSVNGSGRGAYMYLTVPTGAGSWIWIGGTQTMKLNASDYVEVKAGVSMHWDYGSAAWSNFSGHLVG